MIIGNFDFFFAFNFEKWDAHFLKNFLLQNLPWAFFLFSIF